MKKQKRLFPLWPKQVEFLDAPDLVKGFVGGIGSGKTRVGAYDLLTRAQPGRLYLVAAPTYRMLEDTTYRTFKEVAQLTCQYVRDLASEFAMIVRAGDGEAEVLFRSADQPDKLRGPNLSGVWLDEASLVEHDAYRVLTQRLREKGDAGWITCTFTPKGTLHWTYEVFGTPKPGTRLVHARTDENPFLAERFLANVGESHAGLIAEQELGGQFIELGDVEWPAAYFDWPGFYFDEWPNDICMPVMALDPSKGKRERNDFSAFVLLALDGKGQLWCEAFLDRCSAERLVQVALLLVERFRPQAFVIESNMMQELFLPLIGQAAAARNLTVPLYSLQNKIDKEVRIRQLGPRLAKREIHFRDTDGTRKLVVQLKSFPLGQDPKSGVHDDGPDALEQACRMMLHMLKGRKANQEMGSPVPYGGG